MYVIKINIMKKIILSFVALSFTFGVYSQTIVEAAVSNKDFSTLVTALKSADLVGALSGEGPFTVFAPNNDAFAKIDSETLGNLLKPENVKALTNILTYHVVSGKLMASDVVNAINENGGEFTVTTLQGGDLTLKLWEGSVYVMDNQGGKAKVVIADVDTSNGVIHAIDNVVIPE